MKNLFPRFFNHTLGKFLLVGVINTLFGTGIMFLFYNVFLLNYWISSAANYFFGSILSYILNKTFTFRHQGNSPKTLFRFVINIVFCYFIAYGCAKPLIRQLFSSLPVRWQENLAMFVGMCFFVFLNYFGQRFFVFRQKTKIR